MQFLNLALAARSPIGHNAGAKPYALRQVNTEIRKKAAQTVGVREARQPFSSETYGLARPAQPLARGVKYHENQGGLKPRAQAKETVGGLLAR